MISVVGIGLDGAQGLSAATQQLVSRAQILVGSTRHLSYFPEHPTQRLELGDLSSTLSKLQALAAQEQEIVVLTSGDPLFFGLGRLLLEHIAPDCLTFYPAVSSVQLAFARIKQPWQEAQVISAHGRSLERLIRTLQTGARQIAVLTSPEHSPGAIARLLQSLNLPLTYDFWICENLGGLQERVAKLSLSEAMTCSVAPLNLVLLVRQDELPQPESLPILGIADRAFLSFEDRPGLITKREVRVLTLSELTLEPGQTVWDIGAGTGSVSIEIARLLPTGAVYAIEKTAAGVSLIERNCQRLGVSNVQVIAGIAPEVLASLPDPDRVCLGGSGGELEAILEVLAQRLKPAGVLVANLATLEHLHRAQQWLTASHWEVNLLQANLARSVPVGSLTRFTPLNPVTLLRAVRPKP
ncbi:precorrin-6y C5,15-methyltransferase (decarboxylating) subunit CbiE [Leptolyngbya sp. FACHB-261]|uniref:precorrin-6y C5,15-methyltransferase (decarboxylating) subunit CbiE n=1 Tax=Leptolyngbya sp. FACHB-261 TaxID=2692806 RepID=UPI0016860607|nr:precorrin-6y C5,15-methyltransferase (decarboxylating) subunit CbiE [Leptolyngbya sp. FACHB-261]MBD2103314.1 precorrin-6y C5,15-methyltransferase (decarboxylating) subunit CbiE [Leptolyngbya sp. FACHB-261]